MQEVERGSFTPLVFSSSGGMGKAAMVEGSATPNFCRRDSESFRILA